MLAIVMVEKRANVNNATICIRLNFCMVTPYRFSGKHTSVNAERLMRSARGQEFASTQRKRRLGTEKWRNYA